MPIQHQWETILQVVPNKVRISYKQLKTMYPNLDNLGNWTPFFKFMQFKLILLRNNSRNSLTKQSGWYIITDTTLSMGTTLNWETVMIELYCWKLDKQTCQRWFWVEISAFRALTWNLIWQQKWATVQTNKQIVQWKKSQRS